MPVLSKKIEKLSKRNNKLSVTPSDAFESYDQLFKTINSLLKRKDIDLESLSIEIEDIAQLSQLTRQLREFDQTEVSKIKNLKIKFKNKISPDIVSQHLISLSYAPISHIEVDMYDVIKLSSAEYLDNIKKKIKNQLSLKFQKENTSQITLTGFKKKAVQYELDFLGEYVEENDEYEEYYPEDVEIDPRRKKVKIKSKLEKDKEDLYRAKKGNNRTYKPVTGVSVDSEMEQATSVMQNIDVGEQVFELSSEELGDSEDLAIDKELFKKLVDSRKDFLQKYKLNTEDVDSLWNQWFCAKDAMPEAIQLVEGIHYLSKNALIHLLDNREKYSYGLPFNKITGDCVTTGNSLNPQHTGFYLNEDRIEFNASWIKPLPKRLPPKRAQVENFIQWHKEKAAEVEEGHQRESAIWALEKLWQSLIEPEYQRELMDAFLDNFEIFLRADNKALEEFIKLLNEVPIKNNPKKQLIIFKNIKNFRTETTLDSVYERSIFKQLEVWAGEQRGFLRFHQILKEITITTPEITSGLRLTEYAKLKEPNGDMGFSLKPQGLDKEQVKMLNEIFENIKEAQKAKGYYKGIRKDRDYQQKAAKIINKDIYACIKESNDLEESYKVKLQEILAGSFENIGTTDVGYQYQVFFKLGSLYKCLLAKQREIIEKYKGLTTKEVGDDIHLSKQLLGLATHMKMLKEINPKLIPKLQLGIRHTNLDENQITELYIKSKLIQNHLNEDPTDNEDDLIEFISKKDLSALAQSQNVKKLIAEGNKELLDELIKGDAYSCQNIYMKFHRLDEWSSCLSKQYKVENQKYFNKRVVKNMLGVSFDSRTSFTALYGAGKKKRYQAYYPLNPFLDKDTVDITDQIEIRGADFEKNPLDASLKRFKSPSELIEAYRHYYTTYEYGMPLFLLDHAFEIINEKIDDEDNAYTIEEVRDCIKLIDNITKTHEEQHKHYKQKDILHLSDLIDNYVKGKRYISAWKETSQKKRKEAVVLGKVKSILSKIPSFVVNLPIKSIEDDLTVVEKILLETSPAIDLKIIELLFANYAVTVTSKIIPVESAASQIKELWKKKEFRKIPSKIPKNSANKLTSYIKDVTAAAREFAEIHQYWGNEVLNENLKKEHLELAEYRKLEWDKSDDQDFLKRAKNDESLSNAFKNTEKISKLTAILKELKQFIDKKGISKENVKIFVKYLTKYKLAQEQIETLMSHVEEMEPEQLTLFKEIFDKIIAEDKVKDVYKLISLSEFLSRTIKDHRDLAKIYSAVEKEYGVQMKPAQTKAKKEKYSTLAINCPPALNLKGSKIGKLLGGRVANLDKEQGKEWYILANNISQWSRKFSSNADAGSFLLSIEKILESEPPISAQEILELMTHVNTPSKIGLMNYFILKNEDSNKKLDSIFLDKMNNYFEKYSDLRIKSRELNVSPLVMDELEYQLLVGIQDLDDISIEKNKKLKDAQKLQSYWEGILDGFGNIDLQEYFKIPKPQKPPKRSGFSSLFSVIKKIGSSEKMAIDYDTGVNNVLRDLLAKNKFQLDEGLEENPEMPKNDFTKCCKEGLKTVISEVLSNKINKEEFYKKAKEIIEKNIREMQSTASKAVLAYKKSTSSETSYLTYQHKLNGILQEYTYVSNEISNVIHYAIQNDGIQRVDDLTHFIERLKDSLDTLNRDKDSIRTFMMHFDSPNEIEELMRFFEQSNDYNKSVCLQKLIIQFTSLEYDFTVKGVLDAIDKLGIKTITELYKYPPFPKLNELNNLKKVSGGKKTSEFDKDPADRNSSYEQFRNGMKLVDAIPVWEKIKKQNGHFPVTEADVRKFSKLTVEARYMKTQQLQELLTKESLQKLKRSAKKEKDFNMQLVSRMAEYLYRVKGEEINASQYLAILGQLNSNGHCVSEIGTGEGKSRINMILLACEAAQGRTTKFITSDVQLATRDYLSYKPFFSALGIQTGIISANSDFDDFRKGGINFSDADNYELFMNRIHAVGLQGQYLDPDPANESMILDEADQIFFDSVNREYNLSQRSIERYKDLGKFYELLIDFLHPHEFSSDDFREEFLQIQQQLKNSKTYYSVVEKLSEFIREKSTDQEWSRFEKLTRDDLCDKLDAAMTAITNLKEGEDYIIKHDERRVINGKAVYTSVAKVKSGDKVSERSRFSGGVQQALHAYLNYKMKYKDDSFQPFVIEDESQVVYSSNSRRLLDSTKKGRLYACTGTDGGELLKEESAYLYGKDVDAQQLLNMDSYKFPRFGNFRRNDNYKISKNQSDKETSIENYIKTCLRRGQPILLVCKNDNEIEKYRKLANQAVKKFNEEKKEYIYELGQELGILLQKAADLSEEINSQTKKPDEVAFLKKHLSELESRIAEVRLEILNVTSNDSVNFQTVDASTSDKDEARLIKTAGQKNMITISTGVLGRGKDIKPYKGCVNGLGVIASFLPNNQEMNQIFGRAGRKGQKGNAYLVVDESTFKKEDLERFKRLKHGPKQLVEYHQNMLIKEEIYTHAIRRALHRLKNTMHDVYFKDIDKCKPEEREGRIESWIKFGIEFQQVQERFIQSASQQMQKENNNKTTVVRGNMGILCNALARDGGVIDAFFGKENGASLKKEVKKYKISERLENFLAKKDKQYRAELEAAKQEEENQSKAELEAANAAKKNQNPIIGTIKPESQKPESKKSQRSWLVRIFSTSKSRQSSKAKQKSNMGLLAWFSRKWPFSKAKEKVEVKPSKSKLQVRMDKIIADGIEKFISAQDTHIKREQQLFKEDLQIDQDVRDKLKLEVQPVSKTKEKMSAQVKAHKKAAQVEEHLKEHQDNQSSAPDFSSGPKNKQ